MLYYNTIFCNLNKFIIYFCDISLTFAKTFEISTINRCRKFALYRVHWFPVYILRTVNFAFKKDSSHRKCVKRSLLEY